MTTLTATYHDDLSRVTVDYESSPDLVADNFARTVSSGWGTSDTGDVWTVAAGPAADYSVSGGVGKVTMSATVTRYFVTTPGPDDVDISVTTSVPTPTGANIQTGLVARYTDDLNHYLAQAVFSTTGALSIMIHVAVAGAYSQVAFLTLGTGYVGGVPLRFRFRAAGTTFSAKVWGVGDPEPDWQVSGVDTTWSTGAIGVEAIRNINNTNTGAVATFDRFVATNPSMPDAVTFQHSDDGAVWSDVRGGLPVAVTGGATETDSLAASDTFTRTTSSTWGDADMGGTWQRSAANGPTVLTPVDANWSTTGGSGRLAFTATNVRQFSTIGTGLADVDLTVRVVMPAVAVGAPFAVGPVLRFADVLNHYLFQCTMGTDGFADLTIVKRLAGTATSLGQAFDVYNPIPGDVLAFRCVAIGNVLKLKTWFDNDPEPAAWNVTVTDGDLASGAVGVQGNLNGGNTNTTPVNLDYDNLTVTDLTLDTAPDNSGSATVQDYEFFDGTTFYRVLDDAGSVIAVDGAPVSVTVNLADVWLKSPAYPFLNRKVKVVGVSDITRPTRNGVFPVIGRSYSVGVTDLRTGRELTLSVMADTQTAALDLEGALAAGDVMFLQAPTDSVVPTGYFVVGDVTTSRPTNTGPARVLSLPLTEVAAPGPDVLGTTITWAGVAKVGAWQAVDNPTWRDTLSRVGAPSDLIVP